MELYVVLSIINCEFYNEFNLSFLSVNQTMDPVDEFELNNVNVTPLSIIPTCDHVLNLENDDDEYDRILKMFDEFLELIFK